MKIVLTLLVMIYGISIGISWINTFTEVESRKSRIEETYKYLLPTELPKNNNPYKF